MAWGLGCGDAFGQGALEDRTILRTLETQPLLTYEQAFLIPQDFSSPFVRFRFGFETDEVFSSGGFFDSATVSFSTFNGETVVYVATLDAGTDSFAPMTPGAYPLSRSDIYESVLAPPLIEPGLMTKKAYELSVLLPEAFIGQQNTLYLDLFDNQNGVESLAWVSGVVLIPEPSVSWLLLGGALFFLIRKSRCP